MNSRAVAAQVLLKVVNDASPLDHALRLHFDDTVAPRDRSFIQELCYGVMRWYVRLEFITDLLLDKPLKYRDRDILMLLMLGIYQLEFLRTAEHAAVSATVDACSTIKKPWAKKLVNAILRKYQREKKAISSQVEKDSCARYSHPAWLISQFSDDWPGYWQEVLEANNQYPPMHLRVNQRLVSREQYLDKLEQAGIAAQALGIAEHAIKLLRPVAVEQLPGFLAGLVSVQDQGAQLAATLLDLQPGQCVLDACAAPGGKSAHIAETEKDLDTLTAIEIDPLRVQLLEATRQRLLLDFSVIHADASKPGSWWDGRVFDRILLDAPCSASGVIRRHPDIKHLREAGQFSKLTALQATLLRELWPLLDEDGKMVYSTCSMFSRENDAQLEKHLLENNDAELIEIKSRWGVAAKFGRQSLPTHGDTDGFYYAVIRKKRVK